jgi:hypothetical protein
MQWDDLEKTGGKVPERKSCDPRLPCHYGGPSTPASKRNPDAHLGAAEDNRWNEQGIALTSRDREVLRDHYGFRLPETQQHPRDPFMD